MKKVNKLEGDRAQHETLAERIEDAIYRLCSGGIVFKLEEPQHWQLNTLYNKVFKLLRTEALEDSFKGLTEEQINGLSFEQILGRPGIEPPTLVELDDMGDGEELALRLSISQNKFEEVMKRLQCAISKEFSFNFKL